MDKKDSELQKKFHKIAKEAEPKPNLLKNCIMAFLFGGAICTIGQGFFNLYTNFGFAKDDVSILVSATMIFLGAFLTGLGVYDKLANYAGAGTVVPITGFANSIVSPAIEFKSEGYVFGVGAKMFAIAGPVLVYGISSSVLVGIIYYIVKYVI